MGRGKSSGGSYGSYLTIPRWMVSPLNLSGDELLIFAIIYSFSQDGRSKYEGTTKYLSQWTGKSKDTVLRILKRLRNKGLIDRTKRYYGANNERYYCDYWATLSRFTDAERKRILDEWPKAQPTLIKGLFGK